ncbi:MAG: DUF2029 domain-containing protein [Methanomassiliicoccaceae archaeon]|nr:DUF2029 domain-containing protein [Methanomassiliicoccaceae archaeon]
MAAVVDRMMYAYRKEYERNPVATLFLTLLFVFLVIFVIAALITNMESAIVALNDKPELVFSDYFESVWASSDSPYTRAVPVMYPPLATLFFAGIGSIVIPYANLVPGMTDHEIWFAIRDSQLGIMSYFIFAMVMLYALHVIIRKLTKGTDLRAEVLFLLILLSFPVIHVLERGNVILLAVVLCFIFIIGHKSENKYVRYVSYIALGCAAGIKLVPAILGILILREKRYKEAGICALIGAAFVFLPFLFTDGTPAILFDTILGYTDDVGAGGGMNFSPVAGAVNYIFSPIVGDAVSTVIAATAALAFLLVSFIVILFDKEMKFWKILALISCALVVGIGLAVPYNLLYLLFPLMFFLISEKELTKGNIFFLICFIGAFALIPGIGLDTPHKMLGLKSVFVMLMSFALMYEGCGRLYRNFRGRHESRAVATDGENISPDGTGQ